MNSKRFPFSSRFTFCMRCAAALFFISVLSAPMTVAADSVVERLKESLAQNAADWQDADFAKVPLSKDDADAAAEVLWKHHAERIRVERKAEMDAREIAIGKLKMPFFYKSFGEKPDDGWSLYISMHGGGGAPARVNDQQWENQKRLYKPKQGIYLAPRAPTNTWDLWHQRHIDDFFDRLITNLIVFEGVNPDRVYLMGYSAGGDGVYQIAPRFADRLGAASMMAGHPNETSPLGLRNLAFSLHMGAKDGAYNRNIIAAQWKEKLKKLHEDDPGGYTHFAKLYEGKGHWMDREDAVAVEWMAKFRRQRFPERVVWKQDDVQHDRFYWLQVPKDKTGGRPLIVATRKGQTISVEKSDVSELSVLLNDEILDLDQDVEIRFGDEQKILFAGRPKRTLQTIAASLLEREDPRMVFSARVDLTLKNE